MASQSKAGSYYGWIRNWVGMENLALWYYDRPDLVHEMTEFVADFVLRLTRRALREGATRADIEREVVSKVPQLVKEGGYSPFVDHAVPPDVPFEDFRYYVQLLHQTCTFA